jgi:hypothetical protein
MTKGVGKSMNSFYYPSESEFDYVMYVVIILQAITDYHITYLFTLFKCGADGLGANDGAQKTQDVGNKKYRRVCSIDHRPGIGRELHSLTSLEISSVSQLLVNIRLTRSDNDLGGRDPKGNQNVSADALKKYCTDMRGKLWKWR